MGYFEGEISRSHDWIWGMRKRGAFSSPEFTGLSVNALIRDKNTDGEADCMLVH